MTGATDQPLDVEIAVAEAGERFRLAAGERLGEISVRRHGAHAASPAACDRLHHDGAAGPEVGEEGAGLLERCRRGRAGKDGHADRGGELAGCVLVAEAGERGLELRGGARGDGIGLRVGHGAAC